MWYWGNCRTGRNSHLCLLAVYNDLNVSIFVKVFVFLDFVFQKHVLRIMERETGFCCMCYKPLISLFSFAFNSISNKIQNIIFVTLLKIRKWKSSSIATELAQRACACAVARDPCLATHNSLSFTVTRTTPKHCYWSSQALALPTVTSKTKQRGSLCVYIHKYKHTHTKVSFFTTEKSKACILYRNKNIQVLWSSTFSINVRCNIKLMHGWKKVTLITTKMVLGFCQATLNLNFNKNFQICRLAMPKEWV